MCRRVQRSILGRLAAALLEVALALWVGGPARAWAQIPPTRSLFGSSETQSFNLAPFTKWTGVVARWKREEATAKGECTAAADADCVPPEWARLLDDLKGLAFEPTVERVNAAMNAHPYVPAIENWGVSEYWETPFEFIRRGGECEDYAIAKFMLLRALGIPNDRLRFVLLHNFRNGQDHAVAVAYADDDILLLDNLLSEVTSTTNVTWYKPYYSINETSWWLHAMPAGPVAALGVGMVADPSDPAAGAFNALTACPFRR